MILFTSDQHFGHRAILQHAGRPFATLADMEDELVTQYEIHVGDDDLVYWLGDCVLGSASRARIARLPGYRILVRGNHDPGPSSIARCFDGVVDRVVLNIADHPVELSHWPYKDGVREGDKREFPFPTRHPGWVLLHGHTHSKARRQGNMIHVGVDAWDFRPVRMAEIERLVKEVFGDE